MKHETTAQVAEEGKLEKRPAAAKAYDRPTLKPGPRLGTVAAINGSLSKN